MMFKVIGLVADENKSVCHSKQKKMQDMFFNPFSPSKVLTAKTWCD